MSLNAVQLDSPSLITLSDLPDDLLRMITLYLFDGSGRGGMNALRLVSKRLMRMVESCATSLANYQNHGTELLPVALKRCVRIECIRCLSRDLSSLERCPDGLKSLYISNGNSLQSLEPLRGCPELEVLLIGEAHYISDLSPLASCSRLKMLTLTRSQIDDLSPLSSMPLLEELSINDCSKVKSLDPLSGLLNLRELDCRGIGRQTSLLPLISCLGLKELLHSPYAVGAEELKRKTPWLGGAGASRGRLAIGHSFMYLNHD